LFINLFGLIILSLLVLFKHSLFQQLVILLQDAMGLMYTVAVEIQLDRHLQQAADQQRTVMCQLPADSLLLTLPALAPDQEPLRPSARLVLLTTHSGSDTQLSELHDGQC
jgi:hypothetical protein